MRDLQQNACQDTKVVIRKMYAEYQAYLATVPGYSPALTFDEWRFMSVI